MSTNKTLSAKHNLAATLIFRLKTIIFICIRTFKNRFSDLEKFPLNDQPDQYPLIATSESELWNPDDNDQNRILTAGKIQNLRIAAKKLNGLAIPASQVFSFWKHIGNPNFGKGYVTGREIREGCIVPSVAGGLCQLSNALYDAALKAGFQIVERHGHTRVIKGSLAERDRDATIKWNYVDLRFKAAQPFIIEVDITHSRLIVRFRGSEASAAANGQYPDFFRQPAKLNDCYSCGNHQCFQHPGKTPAIAAKTITTFILDEKWPEYDAYIKSISSGDDFFILPFRNKKLRQSGAYNWTVKNPAQLKSVGFHILRRMFWMRLLPKSGANVFSTQLRSDRKIALAAAKKIPLQTTHLVVSQNLLPFLWDEGVFGGRTFDVLMTRLPIQKLHERLDNAHAAFPDSKTLNDFRASQKLVGLENTALTRSRQIITPHRDIATIFNHKCLLLNWEKPEAAAIKTPKSNKILFPASALGRKGAYELKQLAIEFKLDVVLAGKATEKADFWGNIKTDFFDGRNFDEISFIVYPAYIEHQPRLLLAAIARGIPAITTTACGIAPAGQVTIVPAGNYSVLRDAVKRQLEANA